MDERQSHPHPRSVFGRISAKLVKRLLGLAGVVGLCAVVLNHVLAQYASSRPDLKRLYLLAAGQADALPVVLIPGAFGSRLADPDTGEELWPGAWHRLFFSSYEDLALQIDPATLKPRPTHLKTTGIAEQALKRDFYGPILHTLTEYGGYVKVEPNTPAKPGQRRLYVFAYDWRLDIVENVRALDQLMRAIAKDYANPGQRVNIVAHSMGGLIARYYLRHGTRDVLDGTAYKVTMEGSANVEKLILLGTPNLGSVSALHGFISGEPVLWNRIAPRTLASFPSGYQLFPHPLNTWLVDMDGHGQHEDLFDVQTWKKFEWSVFDGSQTPTGARDDLLQRYFVQQLERARRLAWMLSVEEPVSPVRYVLFGGGCHATPARLLMERVQTRDFVRLRPEDIAQPKAGVPYDALMTEPGDGRVTKPSLLARETLDPGVPQNEDSFLPVAYAFFLCEGHASLTSNINFQDNLLNALLSATPQMKR